MSWSPTHLEGKLLGMTALKFMLACASIFYIYSVRSTLDSIIGGRFCSGDFILFKILHKTFLTTVAIATAPRDHSNSIVSFTALIKVNHDMFSLKLIYTKYEWEHLIILIIFCYDKVVFVEKKDAMLHMICPLGLQEDKQLFCFWKLSEVTLLFASVLSKNSKGFSPKHTFTQE